MAHLKPSDLMTPEAYSVYLKANKPQLIAHRRLLRVQLGEHFSVQFEDEQTIRYQVQEMLRVERGFEQEGIQQELDAYHPLLPDGSNWKATLLIEFPDVNERKRELARLIDVEDRMFVEVEGKPRVYATRKARFHAIDQFDVTRGSRCWSRVGRRRGCMT